MYSATIMLSLGPLDYSYSITHVQILYILIDFVTAQSIDYKKKYVKIYYGGILVSDCTYFNLYIYLKLCYHKLFYLLGELKFISTYIELLYL